MAKDQQSQNEAVRPRMVKIVLRNQRVVGGKMRNKNAVLMQAIPADGIEAADVDKAIIAGDVTAVEVA